MAGAGLMGAREEGHAELARRIAIGVGVGTSCIRGAGFRHVW